MQQTYIVYVVLAVVFAVALLLIWRASKKRRAVVAPPEEQRPTLEAVPPVAGKLEKAPEKRPPVEKGKDLKEGLEKTRGGFVARIGSLIGKKQIDQALVDRARRDLVHRRHRRQDRAQAVRSGQSVAVAQRAQGRRRRLGRHPQRVRGDPRAGAGKGGRARRRSRQARSSCSPSASTASARRRPSASSPPSSPPTARR